MCHGLTVKRLVVAKRKTNQLEKFKKEKTGGAQRNQNKNKEERYSRVPRLSDTRYSKGNGDMQAAKRD